MKKIIVLKSALLGSLLALPACGDSSSDRVTASEPSSYTPPAQSTASTADPDADAALVVQRTDVLLVDTNNPVGTTNQVQAAGAPAANATETASSQTSNGSKSSKYIDYEVLDAQANSIGTVDAIWENEQGQPAFLAVKRPSTDSLVIIPTDEAQESQNRKVLRVPYLAETVNESRKFDSQSELDEKAQEDIIAFYEKQPRLKLSAEPAKPQPNRENTQVSQLSAAKDTNDLERLNQATIRLKEEQLKVGKRKVNAGGVILRKIVRTETVNKPVQLQREEFVIERVPGTGKPIEGNQEFAEREIFIPLIREEAVVEKDVVLKEVVNVGKELRQTNEQVNAKLREEELQIEQQKTSSAVGAPATGTQESANSEGARTPAATEAQSTSTGNQVERPEQE